jgi:hypothetical protein
MIELGAFLVVGAFLVLARRAAPGPTQVNGRKGPVMDTSLPRGIRNNNPGNIERRDRWHGMAADQSADPRFAVFVSPEYGIRAMAVLLINYQRRYGLNTLRGIIGRWAPSSENNTAAYVASVSRAVGIGPDEAIDNVASILPRLIPAIIQHENGMQPYPQRVINRGIDLA